MTISDVTAEYMKNATPGKGTITYDDKYNVAVHQDEISMGELLHKTFGGDITLLTESTVDGEKRADYWWNGRLWDLKTPTSEKAANTAIKRGLRQIKPNPGGIILNYGDLEFEMSELQDVITQRMQWLQAGCGADIMILGKEKVIKVLRYKK